MKRSFSKAFFAFAVLLVPLCIAHAQENYTEVKDSLPVRETRYLIRVPKEWNGTLLNDLDYASYADSPRNLALLEKGYALSGTERRADRRLRYDPAHEIHDFISIFDIFEAKFGKPKRTIQLGCSGGGTVTLAMAEIHPDRIDGAIAADGATSPWMANTHLDGLFVLKALLAPDLPIVNLGRFEEDELEAYGKQWEAVIEKAQKTSDGRARIALAITIGQWAAWGGLGEAPGPKPDPNDVRALQESMVQSLVRLVPSPRTWGTSMLEAAGGGQLRWNTGVDYKSFYENGNAGYRKAVEALYQEANVKLEEDLEAINAFPRIAADKKAIKYWSAPGRMHVGEPKVPLFRMASMGDGLVYPTMAQGYADLVEKNGYSELFRSAYVDRWGHCPFSVTEWLVALETMVQRLETGVWPETTPEALNALGVSINPNEATQFGVFDRVEKYNRTWVPSVEDYVGGSTSSAQWFHKPSPELLEETPGLRHEIFQSASMKTSVGYSVVLPPSYEEGDRRYPVVYWLHGGGGNECSSVFTSKVWQKLYAPEEVGEVILVYPNGFRSGYMDHIDGKVMVETMIIQELIPRIDQRFRTVANRSGRAAHGFSMGASGSLKFAIKYPGLFGAAVAYGGGAIDLEHTDRKFVLDILEKNLSSDPELIRQNNTYHFLGKNQGTVRENGTRFLLICGAEDSWKDTAESFHAALTEKRIPCELKIVPEVGHQLAPLIDAEGMKAARFQNEAFGVAVVSPN